MSMAIEKPVRKTGTITKTSLILVELMWTLTSCMCETNVLLIVNSNVHMSHIISYILL